MNPVRSDTTPRWKAICEYRSDAGVVDVEHLFEEIEELHGLIERGPDWSTLIRCTITLNRTITGREHLTIERAVEE